MPLVFLLFGLKAALVHWVRTDLGRDWDSGHSSPSQRIGHLSVVGLVGGMFDSSEVKFLEQVVSATCFLR